MNLDSFLRDVPDFPKPGIMFKDISPLLASAEAMRYAIDAMAERVADMNIQRVAGVESRGFLFGTPLALKLGIGFTPIRKPGKLPAESTGVEYALEYGTDRLEIHNDGLHPGDRVLVVDDVLATGGTAQAACELVQLIGGEVAACVFLLELGFLNGRDKLPGQTVVSLLIND
jgi:adenine phosphoribosyltransferase